MTDKFEQFVRDMAALTTPTDPDELDRRRQEYAEEYKVPLETATDDDALGQMTGDEEYEEANAFWEMIRQARKLLEGDAPFVCPDEPDYLADAIAARKDNK